MQHNIPKGVACVLFAMCVWSGWMVVSRFAVLGSLTPYDVTAIRITTAGILLLPVVWRRGLRIGPWGLASGFLLSLLTGALYINIAIIGMKFAPASHASTVINGTMFLSITLIGIHGLRESISRTRLLGVGCSVAGILCILIAKSRYGGPEQWIGHVLFVISGLMFGGYATLVRKWKADAVHAVAVVSVFSLITYMPLYLLYGHSHIGLSNWHEVAFQAVYQGVLTSILALVAFNAAVHYLGAAHAGAFIPLVPVLSTLLAIPVLHEIPSTLEWTGVAAISLGVFLASGVLHWRPAFLTR